LSLVRGDEEGVVEVLERSALVILRDHKIVHTRLEVLVTMTIHMLREKEEEDDEGEEKGGRQEENMKEEEAEMRKGNTSLVVTPIAI